MNLISIALSVGLVAFQGQVKDDRDVVVGMWKIDQKFGLAAEAIKYDKPLDWVITLKKDGTYVWAQYDPYVEGVGRRHRDTKGTFAVNLRDDRLILRTEIMGKRMAFDCVLDVNRRFFVMTQGEKGFNIYQDRRIKFVKVEVKLPPEPKDDGGSGGTTTTGGAGTTGGTGSTTGS